MRRILMAAMLLAWLPASVFAQTPAPAAGPARAGAAPAPALSQVQARQALDVLKDDGRRAQMISVLEAIAAAGAVPQPAVPAAKAPVAGAPAATAPAAAPTADAAAAPAEAKPAMPIPLAPNSLGAQLLVGASDWLSELSDKVGQTVRAVTDFPLIIRWLEVLGTDPYIRAQLFDAGWKLLVVLGLGLAAEWVVARLMQRPLRGLARHAPAPAPPLSRDRLHDPAVDLRGNDTSGLAQAEAGHTEAVHAERLTRRLPAALWLLARRLPYVVAHLVLDLLPVAAVLAVGYGLIGLGLGVEPVTRLVILAALNAYVLFRCVLSLTRMIVAPGRAKLRLAAVSEDTADYVMHWATRIAAVTIFGYTIIETGLLFGLYRLAHDALIKLLALLVHGLLVIIILQKRAAIAALIQPAPNSKGVAARVRALVAPTWHVVAIFYVIALWVVQAMEVPDGYSRLLRAFLVTAAIMAVGRYVLILSLGVLSRVMRPGGLLSGSTPGMQARITAYQPVTRMALKIVVSLLTCVALLEAWGFSALSWFSSNALGGRLVASTTTVGITVIVALLVWESANAGVEGHLARLTAEAQAARSARLRTLLPMMRTALLVAICVVVGLMVLSEIGLNIAPLLAGAGVVGLAIGFGSQKLVQDIITGLFLLLENTMQVGDVVTLGGLSGTVENLSVRTIRLRAVDGAVHIVPFSAVTTVTNMTRDFGYAVLDVSVGLNEEPDHITEVLQEVAKGMRSEPRWSSAINADLDVLGLDKFIDNAWVLRVRIRTTPGQRWAVSRELNRRIKYRFDELAIESPMTSTRILSSNPAPPEMPAPMPA
jgi:small-conductance mechanosensitive channel